MIPSALSRNKKEASAVMSWISLSLSTNALMVLSPLNGNPYQAYVTFRICEAQKLGRQRKLETKIIEISVGAFLSAIHSRLKAAPTGFKYFREKNQPAAGKFSDVYL